MNGLGEQKRDGKFIIIDDICDGGRTFIGIAEAIKEQVQNPEIYLLVTHGIFSAGYNQLMNYFDKIYTTNSYHDFPNAGLIKSFQTI